MIVVNTIFCGSVKVVVSQFRKKIKERKVSSVSSLIITGLLRNDYKQITLFMLTHEIFTMIKINPILSLDIRIQRDYTIF